MRSEEQATEGATALMTSFAERTGSAKPEQRYLWTDAFAVCNLLGLSRVTHNAHFAENALGLIDHVHHTLGRFRKDDSRRGWISGLEESEGERHPTRGGLRIGKRLPERGALEPFDERLEWERDGQYFHYLTRWMHALDQTARARGTPHFNVWARELAVAAHDAFCRDTGGGAKRMVWKMSTDLSRPLVPSMGQHDALDGLVTTVELETTAQLLGCTSSGPALQAVADDFAQLTAQTELATADPLGLGGLLMDAGRVAQLMSIGTPELTAPFGGLLEVLLEAALEGLSFYSREKDLLRPASERLAFRELGLAIGLSAVLVLRRDSQARARFSQVAAARLQALGPYTALGTAIEAFWSEPEHRGNRAWAQHRDINEVMLATSLMPWGYLDLLAFRPALS
jgi:hypothetical protein